MLSLLSDLQAHRPNVITAQCSLVSHTAWQEFCVLLFFLERVCVHAGRLTLSFVIRSLVHGHSNHPTQQQRLLAYYAFQRYCSHLHVRLVTQACVVIWNFHNIMLVWSCRYVVDCGRSKERRLEHTSGVSVLKVCWISQVCINNIT